MSITVRWDNVEQDILCIQFQSEWVWEELVGVLEQAKGFIKSRDHEVYCLAVFDNDAVPEHMMFDTQKLLKDIPENLERVVIVAQPTIVEALMLAFRDIYKQISKLPIQQSLDEARLLIEEMQQKS